MLFSVIIIQKSAKKAFKSASRNCVKHGLFSAVLQSSRRVSQWCRCDTSIHVPYLISRFQKTRRKS